jgi:hypothetical protein
MGAEKMDVEAKQVGRETVGLRRDRGDARSQMFGGRDPDRRFCLRFVAGGVRRREVHRRHQQEGACEARGHRARG